MKKYQFLQELLRNNYKAAMIDNIPTVLCKSKEVMLVERTKIKILVTKCGYEYSWGCKIIGSEVNSNENRSDTTVCYDA